MTATATTSRFFCYSNGNGLCKYQPLNARFGELFVMGKTETAWVLAGNETPDWIDSQIASGMLWEISASLFQTGPAPEA